jgi:hypothetical protein
VSAPAHTRPAPRPSPASALAGGRAAARRLRRPHGITLLVAGCFVVAAISLLWPSQPTYDPWAWIIWGREITEGALDTRLGPSWKPLPVLFTTPFALVGGAAPELWLVVARAGGALAFAFAYRLGARLAGRWAGLIAAGSLLLADEFVRNSWRGNSEGLLVALVLWAVERHLDGKRGHAFLLGFGASLLRPELWPFWGLYGLWLAWREPRWRWTVGLCFVGCGALWFLPEWWGSGDILRAAARARQPNPDSAAFASWPFVEVFRRSFPILMPPVLLGAAIALGRAWRDRRTGGGKLRLALGAVAGVLMLGVAAMTQAGFAGNLRYVALPAALIAVLGGAGWVELVRSTGRRFGMVAAVALALVVAVAFVPFINHEHQRLDYDWQLIEQESALYGDLPLAISEAGGRDHILRCGSIYAGPFDVQAMAWHMHVHGEQVEIFAFPPGTLITGHTRALSVDPRFPVIARTSQWVIRSTCPPTS